MARAVSRAVHLGSPGRRTSSRRSARQLAATDHRAGRMNDAGGADEYCCKAPWTRLPACRRCISGESFSAYRSRIRLFSFYLRAPAWRRCGLRWRRSHPSDVWLLHHPYVATAGEDSANPGRSAWRGGSAKRHCGHEALGLGLNLSTRGRASAVPRRDGACHCRGRRSCRSSSRTTEGQTGRPPFGIETILRIHCLHSGFAVRIGVEGLCTTCRCSAEFAKRRRL